MEVLYRAAKQDSLNDSSTAFQGLPKVQSVFEYLVAKPLKVKTVSVQQLLVISSLAVKLAPMHFAMILQ